MLVLDTNEAALGPHPYSCDFLALGNFTKKRVYLPSQCLPKS